MMVLKEHTFTHLADLFSALSDPTRLRMISVLLEGEMNVGQLASQLEMTESAVSHQLRGLRQLRLVRSLPANKCWQGCFRIPGEIQSCRTYVYTNRHHDTLEKSVMICHVCGS